MFKNKLKSIVKDVAFIALLGLAIHGMLQGLAGSEPLTWFDYTVGVICTLLIAKIVYDK